MSYRLCVRHNDEWVVYGEYKTLVVAEVHRGLILDNETRILEIEDVVHNNSSDSLCGCSSKLSD